MTENKGNQEFISWLNPVKIVKTGGSYILGWQIGGRHGEMVVSFFLCMSLLSLMPGANYKLQVWPNAVPANATLSRMGKQVSSAPRSASTAREEMHLSKWVFRVQQAAVPKPEPASGDNSHHQPFTFYLELINAAYCLAAITQAAWGWNMETYSIRRGQIRKQANSVDKNLRDYVCCPTGRCAQRET